MAAATPNTSRPPATKRPESERRRETARGPGPPGPPGKRWDFLGRFEPWRLWRPGGLLFERPTGRVGAKACPHAHAAREPLKISPRCRLPPSVSVHVEIDCRLAA